jgi:hypothetical protein
MLKVEKTEEETNEINIDEWTFDLNNDEEEEEEDE